MTTSGRLPEELLDMILCNTFTLPQSSFLEWSNASTYACTPPSSVANILSVNRTWTRIGKRHLYEGIILRRKKQAQTLAATLRADAQIRHARTCRTLAQCILRLRIDGIQSKAVEMVLRAATNVEALHISLPVPARARPIDWVGAFRCISPQVLYIQGTTDPFQAKANQMRLASALHEAVDGGQERPASWSRIREVHMDKYVDASMPKWGDAFRELPSLRLVTISTAQGHSDQRLRIERAAENTGLEAILVHHVRPGNVDPTRLSGRAAEITYYGPFDLLNLRIPQPDLIEDQRPMTARRCPSAEELPEAVWSRIFSYVMLHSRFHQSGKELLLVDKRFKKLAEPLMYSRPVLAQVGAFALFARTLYSRPELTQHIRVLDSTVNWSGVAAGHGFKLFTGTLPNLREIDGVILCSLDPDKDRLVPHTLPPSLLSLTLACASASCRCMGKERDLEYPYMDVRLCLDDHFCNSVPALEYLALCACIVRTPQVPLSSAYGLASLKKLQLFLDNGANEGIQCLNNMHLPSLESVAINLIDASHEAVNVLQAFFSRHGTELRHITFQGQGMVHTQRWSTPLLDCCPNLESLDVQSNSLEGLNHILQTSLPHHSLKMLSVTRSIRCIGRRYQSKLTSMCATYLQDVDFTPFVALERVQMMYYRNCRSSAEKSGWPQIARDIKERCPTASLVNEDGHVWARY